MILPPPPRSIMWRATAREQRKVPVALMAMVLFQAASSMRMTGPGPGAPPALLTRMSMRPKASSAWDTMASTVALSVTSTGTARARTPASRTWRAVSSRPSRSPSP